MSRYWYYYVGGNETSPSNYLQVPSANPNGICVGGTIACTIYARPSPTDPIRPATLSTNIFCPSFTGLHFEVSPIVRVAIESKNPCKTLFPIK